MVLFLFVTIGSVAAAQSGTLGERAPTPIDFNARIDGAQANRVRLEKRLRTKNGPKRVARVVFGPEKRRTKPETATVRLPAAQKLRQSGSFELVMRPAAKKP